MQKPSNPADSWKPRVITVHGVGVLGFSGAWQQDVANTLGEHFLFDPIRHSFYRFLAGTELVLEPLIWLLWVPVWWAFFSGRMHALRTWAASVLILLLAYALRHLRHALAFRSIRQKLADRMSDKDVPPHLIAHSLGSYLSCRTLLDDDRVAFRRVILVGSVVDGEYPWANLCVSAGRKFEGVFNEVAPLDLVVRLAALVRRWLPNRRFGSSGVAGFAGSRHWVHYLNEPLDPCALCELSSRQAPVHNIQYRHAGHSSAFTTPEHASVFWLPYLWGYDPGRFAKFNRLCAEAHQLETRKDFRLFRKRFQWILRALRTASWGLPRHTLQDHINLIARQRWRKFPTPRDNAFLVLFAFRAVVRAQAAVEDRNYPNRALWLRCLRPSAAVDYAFSQVLPHGL
jgi:hypothetical protein